MPISCNQCNQDCKGRATTECFACGLPVCTSKYCSDKFDSYYTFGTKRLCANCWDEHAEHHGLDKFWSTARIKSLLEIND